MAVAYLIIAIACEVAATVSLRYAALGRHRFYIAVVIGYALAFTALSLGLHHGLALGVAYGIWAAAGVALTAVAGRALFKEPLTRVMSGGIALIIGGVLLIELGATQ